MPVPFPVVIKVKQPPAAGALPLGFKGNLQETMTAFAAALDASVQMTLLTGKIGGSRPTQPVGPAAPPAVPGGKPVYPPWLNGNDWYFWDTVTGKYQPGQQGTMIGSIAMWGGPAQTIPGASWLLCDGSAVSRVTFSRLFRVIGGTWGAGDGSSTFNLPPSYNPAAGGQAALPLYFCGGPGLAAPNGRGGAPSYKIVAKLHLPKLWAQVHGIHFTRNDDHSQSTMEGVTGETGTIDSGFRWPLIDRARNKFGGHQVGVPTIPPWCAINYIIKYQ
jgi:hypothetical protein